ncbi:MAG TPA: tetratricopeptide repeat protein [Polyangiales bacterium]|nr:tetratricopeptide repeat protein [Polyangiales bacterium]
MSTSDWEQDPALVASLSLDDRGGPAPRITRDRASAMVEQALASMPLAALPAAEPKAAGVRAWLRVLAVAAGALLMLTGGVALARYAWQELFAEPTPSAGHEQTAVPAVQSKPAAVQPAAEAAPDPEPDPGSATDPESDSDSEAVADSEAAAGRAVRLGKSEALAPDDLLQKANRLRSLGDFAEAAATYSQVYERDARSLSAYVAQVAAASIELEHLAHPARAKKLFERALRAHPDGALDLEARQGLALSLRDLGDASGEATALRSLVSRHPKSPAAKRAALRLGELGSAAE